MEVKNIPQSSPAYPERLRQLAQPPKELFTLGRDVNELLGRPCVTVVGSRKISPYGRAVTSQLVRDMAQAGIVIISGLAFGVDSLAHKTALEVGGATIAVLPSPLDRIYPLAHYGLARQIVAHGGALVSEYPSGTNIYKQHFIARNRIAAGLCDVILITEAAQKSGSLHTARFALEQGKDVLAVPGNITSSTSVGTNNLIKSGATPVTHVNDIFYTLGMEQGKQKTLPTSNNPDEQVIIHLLGQGMSNGNEILTKSSLSASRFNQALTMLEIRHLVRPIGNNHWSLL